MIHTVQRQCTQYKVNAVQIDFKSTQYTNDYLKKAEYCDTMHCIEIQKNLN